jgi:ectoine hydroxylase-related dioxygenase (phytanoyl-CoA dioxygenase family)
MSLQYFKSDAVLEDVLRAIKEDGGVILVDAAPENNLDNFVSELEPYLATTPYGRDDFTGHKTRRTGALIARMPSSHNFVMDDRVLSLAKAFLSPYTEKITLHLSQATTIYPDEEAQLIHRDRFAWGTHIPKVIEPQFNTLWAITDFTPENGATRIVPGSQNWSWDKEAKPDQIVQAEMSRGSVLLYTGTVLHGGGQNKSKNPRVGLNLTYCLAWLRQQENQYLSCPPHIAKSLDEELQELIGYTQGTYGLGYFSDPEKPAEKFDLMVPELALGRGPRHRAEFNTDQLSKVEST